MSNEIYFFGAFSFIVILVLFVDLGLFNKKDHVISYREAAAWTVVWVMLAMSCYFYLKFAGEQLHDIVSFEQLQEIVIKNKHDVRLYPDDFELSLTGYRNAISLEFLTGYLIEYSLSVDNIFVIILIFTSFGVQKKYYHRVLFWGILGAVFARMAFIFGGGYFITNYTFILYLFALFLMYTGVKMFLNRNEDENFDTENHPMVKFASKIFRVHKSFEGNHFFIKKEGKNYITPLFIVLLVVEFSDIIFAVDSIPAIFAITKDTYIVFFSNIFAVLGLRSMFFLLINVMDKLRYFKHGLSFLLVFIGLKMLIHDQLKDLGFKTIHTLAIILLILGSSIIFSLIHPDQKKAKKHID